MAILGPDFSKKTKETLAKRAAYKCSNPTCGVLTIGPNSEQDKATSLGQAAHIYGARPSSARYDPGMTDARRSEITNGIWLCGNCHKQIDDDAYRYPPELLFKWREIHQNDILGELGNTEAKTQAEQERLSAELFSRFPPIIRRIVIDKPPAWEWRLTAELMRTLNAPELRRLEDLRNGLYSKHPVHLQDEDVMDWKVQTNREMQILIEPLANLVSRLNAAWGVPGVEGNAEEILHVTKLMRDALTKIVDHEEDLSFTIVSERAENLKLLLQDALGRQTTHYAEIPNKLDEIVELAREREENGYEGELVVKHDIIFELPDGWVSRMRREMERFSNALIKEYKQDTPQSGASGCVVALIAASIVFFFFSVLG